VPKITQIATAHFYGERVEREPITGSGGRAPGQGVRRQSPLKLKTF